jgi:hypothetical protein
MNQHIKRPTMTDAEVRKELMNDSLGTIDTADSTGSSEEGLHEAVAYSDVAPRLFSERPLNL